MRNFPPARRSACTDPTVIPSPIRSHCLICEGSVHAFHTRSRGLLSSRVITSLCPVAPVVALLFAVMFFPLVGCGLIFSFSFSLGFRGQIFLQPVEVRSPEIAVILQPRHRLAHRRGLDFHTADAPLLRRPHQPRPLQYHQML